MSKKPAVRKSATPIEADAPKETREEKLARLAPKRVNIALNRIRLIGNLAAYRPTDPQVDKICQTLAEACVKLEARLRGSRRDVESFTL